MSCWLKKLFAAILICMSNNVDVELLMTDIESHVLLKFFCFAAFHTVGILLLANHLEQQIKAQNEEDCL
jgi:hypothetical protein